MDSQADFQDFGLSLEHFLSDTQGHPKKQMQETRMEMKSQFRKNELWPCPCLPEKRTREHREISLQPRGCMVSWAYFCSILPWNVKVARCILVACCRICNLLGAGFGCLSLVLTVDLPAAKMQHSTARASYLSEADSVGH